MQDQHGLWLVGRRCKSARPLQCTVVFPPKISRLRGLLQIKRIAEFCENRMMDVLLSPDLNQPIQYIKIIRQIRAHQFEITVVFPPKISSLDVISRIFQDFKTRVSKFTWLSVSSHWFMFKICQTVVFTPKISSLDVISRFFSKLQKQESAQFTSFPFPATDSYSNFVKPLQV